MFMWNPIHCVSKTETTQIEMTIEISLFQRFHHLLDVGTAQTKGWEGENKSHSRGDKEWPGKINVLLAVFKYVKIQRLCTPLVSIPVHIRLGCCSESIEEKKRTI